MEVMRIKAQDLDLEATDNWEAVFDIVKGNEAGYFSISTDPVTNEGILMLDKVLQKYMGVCKKYTFTEIPKEKKPNPKKLFRNVTRIV